MVVTPGMTYAVGITDRRWAAPTRFDVQLRSGLNAIDFRVGVGTLIQGRVTAGTPPRALAGTQVRTVERSEDHNFFGQSTQTDADGRFSIRVAEGNHELCTL